MLLEILSWSSKQNYYLPILFLHTLETSSSFFIRSIRNFCFLSIIIDLAYLKSFVFSSRLVNSTPSIKSWKSTRGNYQVHKCIIQFTVHACYAFVQYKSTLFLLQMIIRITPGNQQWIYKNGKIHFWENRNKILKMKVCHRFEGTFNKLRRFDYFFPPIKLPYCVLYFFI